jgi:hypothetical protein
MSEVPDKQFILERMQAAIHQDGKAPGAAAFENKWGVKAVHRKRYWPTHSRLVEDAGAKANQPLDKIPENDLFHEYARVCLHYGHIPTLAELKIATRELGTRTGTVQSRFGTLAEFNQKFREWVPLQSDELRVISVFEGWGRVPFDRADAQPTVAAVDRASAVRPFLPAGLQDLHVLAENQTIEGDPRAAESSAGVIFERSCADAFRALGFQVRPLGQVRGRVADCIALARAERYAVVIDAKARREGFTLGIEDRKLLEYAKRHTTELKREGIEHVYLCVVSSRFREKDSEVLRDVFKDSGLRGFSLWPAETLMKKVEDSIRNRSDFTLSKLEGDFLKNGVVAA